MASKATLVFRSALYRFRCTDIVFLLLAGFSIPSFYLIDLSSFLVPSYRATLCARSGSDGRLPGANERRGPRMANLVEGVAAPAMASGGPALGESTRPSKKMWVIVRATTRVNTVQIRRQEYTQSGILK